MNTDINTPTPEPLLRLADADRARLGEALQALLAHGSILGLEPGDGDLYAWSRQNFDWLREMAALAGLAVSMEHESRLIQAVPERPALTLNLRQDVTIVLLALWYEYDTQVRDHGAAQVTLSVEQLNQLLKEKLLPDLKSQPSAGRMLEILRRSPRLRLPGNRTVELTNIRKPAKSLSLQAEALVAAAHKVCPYSNATRGNIDVTLTVV